MLYDLNIPWSPSTNSAELQRTLKFAFSLGYQVAALNQTIPSPILSPPDNQIPLLTPPPASHPQPSGTAPSSSAFPRGDKLPTILRRATIEVSDPKADHRLAAFSAEYDLVAVRPTTERAFSAACTDMSHFSFISLDLTTAHPFHFHHRTAMAAVSRGLLFEICYSQVLTASDDDGTGGRARSNFVANLMGLVRATKGRGLVLSSEARGPLDLRAPADVVNLFAVWGLNAEKGTEGLGVNPRSVVMNEGLKRRGFRGVVDIVRPAEGGPATAAWEKPEKDDKKPGKNKKKGGGGGGGKAAAGKADRGEQHKQGQKRSNGEVDRSSGDAATPAKKKQAKELPIVSPKETSKATR